MDWTAYKDEAARLAFDKDALHIYAAVAIQVAVATLSRRTLGHWLPWLVVLGLEGLNEALDIVLSGEPEVMPWQIVGLGHDVINTMIMPTLLLLTCRYRPALVSWSSVAPGDPPQPTVDIPRVTVSTDDRP